MALEKWNESGRVWEEDHGLLDAEQVAKCERADVAEPRRSPIPTRMISNGEYMPVPQTEKQPMREKYGYPELTESAKRKILGLTSARLYGITALDAAGYRAVPKDYESRMSDKLKTVLEVGELKADNMSKMKETYAALAIEPDHTRYGWMRVRA